MKLCHRVHNYLIGDVIARGRFASVRVCFNHKSSKPLVAKIISKKIKDSKVIFNERYLAPLLVHPNILKVEEVFDTQSMIFQISKFYQHDTLLNELRSRKIAFSEKMNFVYDILAAIYYMHTHFICHRDLKLENILVSEKSRAKICDFGLSTITFDGYVTGKCGSYHYVSPECINRDKYNGFASDMWSLGVLLYTLFTKQFPYPNLDKELNYDSDIDFSEIPLAIRCIVQSLLSKNPNKRPTISDMVQSPLFIDKVKVKINHETIKPSINQIVEMHVKENQNKNEIENDSTMLDESNNYLSDPIDYIDNFSASRVSQILQVDIKECEVSLSSYGQNCCKLFYSLLLERMNAHSEAQCGDNFESIQLSGSCPVGVSGRLLVKSFRAYSKDVVQCVHQYVTSSCNGCVTEPVSTSREIVVNSSDKDTVVTFDCFDVCNDEDDSYQSHKDKKEKNRDVNYSHTNNSYTESMNGTSFAGIEKQQRKMCDVVLTEGKLANEIVGRLTKVFGTVV
ncbi:hypothetical protein TRFO_22525 [Tritrichomonas foetus]|uniref:Protein kinase domain-containing protein n=1 Tax=Tritrichomonas foetus TaxID=1144522 RepID=A0A1J4KD42_9EUKA|nr:hypothetical protein TRFO_22525 [Tritrichomonas foetus]|eukprot:OHT08856.1 hypothetical protein TRFO_22525 [Tritrichomonas foetus]